MEKDLKIEELIPEIKLGDCRILFLDASSSCTGFSILTVDFVNKRSKLFKAGCLWLDPNWEHARKYDYMYNMLQDYFWVVEQIDYIIIEQYSVNTKKMSGVLVSPELHGVIKAAAFSNGVKVSSILPQSWRAELGIKPLGPKGKRDYKTPTALEVRKRVYVPDIIISNITKKYRQTPSDVTDAIAIALAWASKNKLKLVNTDCTYNDYVY